MPAAPDEGDRPPPTPKEPEVTEPLMPERMARHTIKIDTPVTGNVIKEFLNGIAPAVEEYNGQKRAAGLKPGNSELHVVQEMRGFNGNPKVESKSDMDALIAKGDHIDLLRGLQGTGSLTGKDMADEFRNGEHFPGHGEFGSGTYADSNKGTNNAATSQYGVGSNSGIVRMALPKSAKIIKASELEQKVKTNPSAFAGYAYNGGHSPAECWLGVQAAMAGYDAIHVDGQSKRHGSYGKGFYVILNRSILTVQKEDANGHMIQ